MNNEVKVNDLNPKDRAALAKVKPSLLPAAGIIEGAKACEDGALKYGLYNWRVKAIQYMGYLDAIERHRLAIIDGEDYDLKSRVHHLGHIIATASIMLDAISVDKMIDNRPTKGMASYLLANSERKEQDVGSSVGNTTKSIHQQQGSDSSIGAIRGTSTIRS